MTDHGTTRGYRTEGCRCDDCTAAHTLADKKWRLDVARNGPRMVDAEPVARHAAHKAEQWGVCVPTVLEAAGMSRSAAHSVATGQTGITSRQVARTVTALTLDDLPDTAQIPAGRAKQARDRAVATTGWTYQELADASGVSRATISRLTSPLKCELRTLRLLEAQVRCEAGGCMAFPVSGGLWCRGCMDARFGRGRSHYVGAAPTYTGHLRRHGAQSGVRMHVDRGEPLCDPCLEFNREYRRQLKAAA